MRRPVITISLLALSLSASPAAFAATLFVPSPPYPTIMSAVVAATDGDVVEVAPGFYQELVEFLGKAITVRSSAGPQQTFLQSPAPNDPGSVVSCRAGEGSDSVLEGFHISSGGGTELVAGGPRYGLGMYNLSASPTVVNCIFMDLVGDDDIYGAGMANLEGANPTIIDCVFQECIGTRGGGLYCGASSSAQIRNTTFFSNAVEAFPPGTANGGDGGAIYVHDGSSVYLERCTFDSNIAFDGDGGCVYAEGADGVSTLVCVNSLFVFNSANQGAGIFCPAGTMTVTNATFAENTATTAANPVTCIFSQGEVTAANCIFYDNAPANVPLGGGAASFVVSYSDVAGGWPGVGNFDLPPLFTGSYALGAGSPCIDSGNDFADIDVTTAAVENIPEPDLAGAPRFQDDPGVPDTGVGTPPVDRGCYESDGIPGDPFDGAADFVRGDANGDGAFNGLTDGVFILSFGFSGGEEPPCMEAADADDDGIINALIEGVYILNHQFSGGPPPPAPYPGCGPDPDPTGGGFGCMDPSCP